MLTKCDKCNSEFEVPDSSFGKMIPCETCGKEYRAMFYVRPSKDELLGIAICDNCGARHRIKRKNEKLIGNDARCSKCREYFTVTLSDPTANEIDSVEKEQRDRQVNESKEEVKIKNKIANGFRKHHDRLLSIISKGKRNESEIIRYCLDVIKDGLGFSDKEIETELKVLGKRVDIAIKKDEKILMIIECKAANVRLTPAVRNQAARYATNLGTEWAVVTNGHIWQLNRIIQHPGKEPDCIEIFDISLTDEDGISDYEISCLYLLTSYSIESGDTDSDAHHCACTSFKRFATVMCSDKVIEFICKELSDSYQKEIGLHVKVDKEDIEDYVYDIFGELGD